MIILKIARKKTPKENFHCCTNKPFYIFTSMYNFDHVERGEIYLNEHDSKNCYSH